jgi:hypothetical protein
LWKEHPRNAEAYFPDLKAHAVKNYKGREGDIQALSLPYIYPVEMVAHRLNLAACVAGTSAALFYLPRLFQISCYTFGETLLPFMQGVDVFMNDMIRREALPLSKLPPAPVAAEQSNEGRTTRV